MNIKQARDAILASIECKEKDCKTIPAERSDWCSEHSYLDANTYISDYLRTYTRGGYSGD